jgi:hypothetical protein
MGAGGRAHLGGPILAVLFHARVGLLFASLLFVDLHVASVRAKKDAACRRREDPGASHLGVM